MEATDDGTIGLVLPLMDEDPMEGPRPFLP